MQMKRNGFALASAILGGIYFVFIMIYFSANAFFYDSLFWRSSTIHILLVSAALAANLAGYISNARNGLLVSGIAYCISASTFILYTVFLILPIVFSFVAFARMKNQSQNKHENTGTVQNEKCSVSVPIVNSSISRKPLAENQYDFLKFRLAGVSFKNSDGKSRQTLLRKMKFRDPPFDGDSWDINLRQYEFEDEDAVGVYVNGYMIGNVPRENISYVVLNWDRFDAVTSFEVIGGGKTANGEDLKYGAEVYIRFRKYEYN